MRKIMAIITCLFLAGVNAEAFAQQTTTKAAIEGMSDVEIIRTAKSAAPAHISRDATIMAPAPGGQLRTVKQGTGEFTCIADLSGQEVPDPVCADKAATEWFISMLKGDPQPANTEPGIAYMGLGGWHWEKDGQVVMDPATPGAKRVKEPPHWMILWPVDAKVAALPEKPNRFGAFVMFPDTPYAHLMINQDPRNIPATPRG